MADKKLAVIIGAGPAGLTAAYELLDQSKEYDVIVLEESDCMGGISRTVNHNGNRMDMGGHRFFSKVPKGSDPSLSPCATTRPCPVCHRP